MLSLHCACLWTLYGPDRQMSNSRGKRSREDRAQTPPSERRSTTTLSIVCFWCGRDWRGVPAGCPMDPAGQDWWWEYCSWSCALAQALQGPPDLVPTWSAMIRDRAGQPVQPSAAQPGQYAQAQLQEAATLGLPPQSVETPASRAASAMLYRPPEQVLRAMQAVEDWDAPPPPST